MTNPVGDFSRNNASQGPQWGNGGAQEGENPGDDRQWPQLPGQYPTQQGGGPQQYSPQQYPPQQYQQPAPQQPYPQQAYPQLPGPTQIPGQQPTYRPYTGGMPPHLTPAQQRRWHKAQLKARRPKKRGSALNIVLALVVLLSVAGLRITTLDGGSFTDLRDLFSTSSEPNLPPEAGPADGTATTPPRVENPSDSYEFWHVNGYENGEPEPTRWSSCEPIRYVINPKFGDENFLDWVHATVAEVSEASGVAFQYEGITGEEPRPQSPFESMEIPDEWPPVVIQFANEDQIPDLKDNIEGLAIVQQVENQFTGNNLFVTGKVYLDETLLYDRAIDREPAYVHVLRHELAHLVGLSHTDDTKELMHEAPVVNKFGDGDLTGLSKLGGGPCH